MPYTPSSFDGDANSNPLVSAELIPSHLHDILVTIIMLTQTRSEQG